jgi:hypothetical protein
MRTLQLPSNARELGALANARVLRSTFFLALAGRAASERSDRSGCTAVRALSGACAEAANGTAARRAAVANIFMGFFHAVTHWKQRARWCI